MELYIFDKDINLRGVIDDFISLIWIRRYCKSGEFQLTLPFSKERFELLSKGNILYKKGDPEAGYIHTRSVTSEEDGKEILEVKGTFLTSYIAKRINWGTLNFSGSPEKLIRKLVDDNCINPIDPARIIPYLKLGNLNNFNGSIFYQNSYGNVLSEVEEISNKNFLGVRVRFDYKNKNLIFEIYKGVNRTVNQDLLAPCIFSRDFENILSQNFFDSEQDYKNVCLVAGEGEGVDRVLVDINDSSTGLERNELFVDARDLQKETSDSILTDEAYKDVLTERGNSKLSQYNRAQTFESAISTTGNNIYKVDYDLGDTITILDSKLGIKIDTPITEIEEVYEEQKVQINPVFGNNIPTLIDKIKRKMG